MAAPCLIYDDPRPIQSIWFAGEGGGYQVGSGGVITGGLITSIVAYKDHGERDFVPWLAVCRGDYIHARIPASMVQIVYAPEFSGG